MNFISNKTVLANWHELILIAQREANICLESEVEAYVVMALMSHTNSNNLANSILSTQYLEAVFYDDNKKQKMKSVADKCLIYSGLFPLRAKKINVSTSYFINLGRSAYYQLVEYLPSSQPSMINLYEKLAFQFQSISNVIMYMRKKDYGFEKLF